MHVAVYHNEKNGMTPVALVDTPDGLSTDEMLEYAFRWTNNIGGSWSGRETFFGQPNSDYNERVTFIAAAHPKGYGHRSTSVGDLMYIGSNCYEVMPFGFELRQEEVA